MSIALSLVAAGCAASGGGDSTVTVTHTETVTAPAPPARTPPVTVPRATPPPAATTRGTITRGPVVYVSDGDTIGVDLGGPTTTRVRLLGIDAPESKDPGSPAQCFGPQAARLATVLLPRGSMVTVVTDPDQDRVDRYGRLLAYVFRRGERVPVNQTLLERGAARVYVYRRNRPFRRLAAFRAAEARAWTAKLGVWNMCPRDG